VLRRATCRDTVEFGVHAGVSGVTFGAKGTAKVVTSVVPTGGDKGAKNVSDHGGMSVAEIAEMEKEEAEEEMEDIKELKREEYSPFLQLFAASIGMVVIVLIGTFSYMSFDDRTFVEALYFSVRRLLSLVARHVGQMLYNSMFRLTCHDTAIDLCVGGNRNDSGFRRSVSGDCRV
jgi:hypothetical protein